MSRLRQRTSRGSGVLRSDLGGRARPRQQRPSRGRDVLRRAQGRRALVALALLTAACGDPPLLDLRVVTPPGDDPLAGADSLRLSVSSPVATKAVSLENTASFAIEVEAEVEGQLATITLEALTAGALVARGETPPLILSAVEARLALLVARAGAVSTLSPRLPAPGLAPQVVLLPTLGILLAGGAAADGATGEQPSAEATLYDFFTHELSPSGSMPEPRAGGVAGSCGSDCAVVALGSGASALATEILRLDGGAWQAFPDGLSPVERRTGAAASRLSDGTYLIVGGTGVAGILDSALVLDPGQGDVPTLAVLPGRTCSARADPALAAAQQTVLVAGGQAAGDPAAELFYESSSAFQPVGLPGPAPVSGTAVVALDDGRFLIAGGRDANGAPTADAWIVDPVTLGVEHRAAALARPRAGHAAARVGRHVVLVGGETDAGPAEHAEVLGAATLARVAEVPATVRLDRPTVVPLGVGSLLIAGGAAPDGAPVAELEVFERPTLIGE